MFPWSVEPSASACVGEGVVGVQLQRKCRRGSGKSASALHQVWLGLASEHKVNTQGALPLHPLFKCCSYAAGLVHAHSLLLLRVCTTQVRKIECTCKTEKPCPPAGAPGSGPP